MTKSSRVESLLFLAPLIVAMVTLGIRELAFGRNHGSPGEATLASESPTSPNLATPQPAPLPEPAPTDIGGEGGKAATTAEPMPGTEAVQTAPEIEVNATGTPGELSLKFGERIRSAVREGEEGAAATIVAVPDLGWKATLDRDDPTPRIQLPANLHPGVYRMTAQVGAIIVEQPVAILPTPGETSLRRTHFRLESYQWRSFSPPRPDGAMVCVPIFATAWRQHRNQDVPVRVRQQVDFELRDEARKLAPGRLSIAAEETVSGEACVPLRPGDSFKLRAYPDVDGGEPTEPLEVSWAANGPKLRLATEAPTEPQIAGQQTPIKIAVWVEDEAAQWSLPRPIEIQVSVADNKIAIDPPSFVLQGSETGSTLLRSTVTLATAVQLFAPELGLKQPVQIKFRYPTEYLITATLSALVGILVARRKQLLAQSRVALVIELIVALGAGFLVYMGMVNGWLPALFNYVGHSAAIGIGLLGGYVGEGVFQGFAAILRKVFPPAGNPRKPPKKSD